LAAFNSSFSAAVVPGLIPSSTSAVLSQPFRHDSEIPEVGSDGLQEHVGLAATGHPDHVLAKLTGIGLGHGEHPSSGTSRHHRSDVTRSCSSPHLDATLGKELLEIAVRQALPEVPEHRNKITSGGNRNPANEPGPVWIGGQDRRRFIPRASPLGHVMRERNRPSSLR